MTKAEIDAVMEQLREARKKRDTSAPVRNVACKRCRDTGYIEILRDGYVFAAECECLTRAKQERCLKNSGVDYAQYELMSLARFRTDTDSSKQMLTVARRFLDAYPDVRGAGFFGKPGTGKTHICIAICHELLMRRRVPHLYFAYRKEMQRLKAMIFNDEAFGREMHKWTSAPVLYIDDFLKFAAGKNGVDPNEARILYDIVNTRYLNRSVTLFSGEIPVRDMLRLDEAIASRVFEMVRDYSVVVDAGERNRRFDREAV